MKVYFGHIKASDLAEYGMDKEEFFISDNEAFAYVLELEDPETIRLKDSCNRMVPINYEDLDQFIIALNAIKEQASPYVNSYNEVCKVLKELQIAC